MRFLVYGSKRWRNQINAEAQLNKANSKKKRRLDRKRIPYVIRRNLIVLEKEEKMSQE